MKPSPSIERARALNDSSGELRPFHGAPGPLRSNALRHAGAWEGEPAATLSPASRARLARLSPPPAVTALAQGFQPRPTSSFEDVQFTVPVKPAQFKILKKGPRAGQSVPVTMLVSLGIWTLTGTDGTVYRFTSRSANVTVTHPTRPDLKLSPAEFRATARRIWEAETAAKAITFLLGAPA